MENRRQCPAKIKCKSENIIYKYVVSFEKNYDMSYIGSPRRPFKNGLYEYRTSFPKPNKKNHTNCTQLANYLWKLCEKYTIKRKRVIQINSKFKPNFMCSLCNLERLYIANANIRKSEIREMN